MFFHFLLVATTANSFLSSTIITACTAITVHSLSYLSHISLHLTPHLLLIFHFSNSCNKSYSLSRVQVSLCLISNFLSLQFSSSLHVRTTCTLFLCISKPCIIPASHSTFLPYFTCHYQLQQLIFLVSQHVTEISHLHYFLY